MLLYIILLLFIYLFLREIYLLVLSIANIDTLAVAILE